jgi:Sulfotransferase domain
MPRERGAANDNYSRLPAPVITAARETLTGWRMLSAGRRPLPDFLILGAQRSGTTSLYNYLAAHPLVLPAVPSKGVHYFDKHADRSLRWYRAHFPTRAQRRRREHPAGSPTVTGEGSPYYLFHPHGPARAAAAVPDARLIVMLRDPVERAYSHYQQEYARGFEDAGSFEAALDLEPSRLEGER